MDKRKVTLGNTNKPYTDDYKKLCKTTWYKLGRPDSPRDLVKSLPEDKWGRIPHPEAVRIWRDEEGWDIWADDLDLRVEYEMDDMLVAERVRMLKEQASRGRELQTKGIDYLRENDFDSSSSAVNAVIHGAKLERTSRGISERLEKLLTLSDDDLTREAWKLLDQAKESGETLDIDAEDIEDDEETNS